MANRLARADGFLSPHAAPNPVTNQAEAPPAPSHSAVGLSFRSAVLYDCPARDTPQTAMHPERGRHDWHGDVVREQAPLYKAIGYRDLVGAFTARVAKVVTVMSAIRYKGQLPASVQPILEKPNPWSDPTRGLP